jgi:hypothetical protein
MAREELRIPPPAAQITICGALNSTTLAALVELAMAAGAGLILQPRAIPTVVEAAAPPPALPPARVAPARVANAAAVPAAPPAAAGPARGAASRHIGCHRRDRRHAIAPLRAAGPLGEGGALTPSRSNQASRCSTRGVDWSAAPPRRRRSSRGHCIVSARPELKTPSWKPSGTARRGGRA